MDIDKILNSEVVLVAKSDEYNFRYCQHFYLQFKEYLHISHVMVLTNHEESREGLKWEASIVGIEAEPPQDGL